MARRPAVVRYVTGTATQLGVPMPAQRQESAGGLLMLLLGAYLLLAFVTGRLGWLTDTIEDLFAAKDAHSSSSSSPSTPAVYQPNPGRTRTYQPRPSTPAPVYA